MASDANPRIPSFMKLLLFTGWRVRVGMELRWDYIFDNRIEQPESQSKSNRLLVTPLTDEIRSELAVLRQLASDEWVFPSDSASGHATTSNWAKERVEWECDIHFTNHSLRYTFASVGDECGIQQQVVGLLMDHATDSNITSAYQRDAFMAKTSDAIATIDKALAKKLSS